MRTLRAACALLMLVPVAAGVLAIVPASAQGTVALTLRSQTPYSTLDEPEQSFAVRAENLGDTELADLSIGLVVGSPIRSREDYEASLVEGPADVLTGQPFPVDGTLAPGQTREFRFDVDLSALGGISVEESLVYPARLELQTDGVQVPSATLDTPLIHLVREPEVPIRLAWWSSFDAPIALDAQGRLADPDFEAAIAPDGRLSAQVDALTAAVGTVDGVAGLDLVVVPAVVDQLVRMADGYDRAAGEPVAADQPPATHAADLLDRLRVLVDDPDVHVVPAPFAAPLLPSLASGGLAPDLTRQQVLGDGVLATHLDVEADAITARPAAAALDEASLQWLAARGTTTLLVDAATVERTPQPNGFAPLPTATVTTADGGLLELVLPDPGTQALIDDPLMLADPVRAGQAVLGELATIWREQPVPPLQPDGSETVRGVAVALPGSLPAEAWGPIVRRLAEAPFLVRSDAATFAATVHPAQDGATVVPSTARFPTDYVDAIREQRRNVAAYRSMLAEPSPLPDRLERNLLYAEAGEYVADPVAGRGWYDQVFAVTTTIFEGVLPDVAQEFLLTSREGSIPLRMGDPGPTPLTVEVILRSASFEFPGGSQQVTTLEGPDEIVTFDVVAKAGGPQTIKVKTRAPSGRDLGEDQNLAVRTTAVNGVALWITIAAGAMLLLLWARRLVRRRRTP